MLYPNPLHNEQRLAIRRAIERTRYLYLVEEAKKPQRPQPYYWIETSQNELTLTPNLQALDTEIFAKISPDPEGTAFEAVTRMLEEERASQIRDIKSLELLYRKGFTAGCVLLCSFIYDNDSSAGRTSSQAKSELATKKIVVMGAKSVQNFFREFNSVAHLWSAYHICAPQSFKDASNSGIIKYSSNEISFDFLDEIDLEKFLSNAAGFIKYGLAKRTANTTLISSENVLDMTFLPVAPKSLNIPYEILAKVHEAYPLGKRDNLLPE